MLRSSAVVVMVCLLSWGSNGQEVRRVPATYPTIGAALAFAVAGDMIEVGPGIYNESVYVPPGVHLTGAGSGVTTIDGGTSQVTVALNAGTGYSTVIEGMTITGTGHGVIADGGGATLIDCEFVGCGAPSATYGGSAINIEDGSGLRMVRCTVRGCSGPYAVRADTISYLQMVACRIIDNAANGVFIDSGELVDTVVAEHPLAGIVIRSDNGEGRLAQCTVFGNGIGIDFDILIGGCPPSFQGCIVWGNTTSWVSPLPSAFEWSNVEGGAAGVGNISTDPMFVDPLNRNFALMPGSPSRDAGDPAAEVDPDGTRSDQGARSGLPTLGGGGVGNVVVIPCFVGWLPTTSLTVNGSGGGPDRRVAVPVNTPLTLTLTEPWGAPGGFGIAVHLGLPAVSDARLIPDLGKLPFPLCLPGAASPLVFHLTNNIYQDPCALVPSAASPWTFTVPAGFPQPLTLVLQGVVQIDGSAIFCGTASFFRVTNAVVLQVY